MTNHSEAQEAKLTSLLSLEDEPHKTAELRQQEIMHGVRWLATVQALIGLYLLILPKVFINLFLQVTKQNKETKNGS